MDTPLLALTRRRAPIPDGPSPARAAAENMRQLVQLRWIAVVGQLATILIVDLGLGVPLPVVPMLAIVGMLVLANIATIITLRRYRVTGIELLVALLFDTLCFTAQLFLSGGSENPFIWLYLLQVVLGAVLLETWGALLLAAIAGAGFSLLTLYHWPLVFPARIARDIADLRLVGSWLAFAMVALLLILFVRRITRNLNARDAYLRDLTRYSAEEDGIVRMGLFATGAAHELGTPLATLSVVLADWRHMPELAHSEDLKGDLEVMSGEVERCKTIVTNILHSAGEPRGEAMAETPPCRFLDHVIDAWRPTHPSVPLDYRCAASTGARIAADRALRQAVWNLIDNAADFSPQGVTVEGWTRDGQFEIVVSDRGPGFPADMLGEIGRMHRSTKGEGHGIGLFLATNVARRQGGRLEAGNRDGGGAIVRFIIPLIAIGDREQDIA